MITFSNIGNYGHLGNQMFQYASLRGIAANRKFNWSIPSASKFGSNYPLRSSIYECFELSSLEEVNVMKNDMIQNTIVERQFHFDEELFNQCPDDIDLSGYFQSYRYFNNIEQSIRDDYTFKPEIIEKANSLLDGINLSNTVSIHVRRTDYLLNSMHHTNMPIEFYSKIIGSIGNIDSIVVFSDDIEWCKSQFIGNQYIFSNESAYVDMCAMSMCRTNIMANSSFSWWASWLNEWKNKLVLAPNAWFGPANSHLNTQDLVPKDWIKL